MLEVRREGGEGGGGGGAPFGSSALGRIGSLAGGLYERLASSGGVAMTAPPCDRDCIT